ncbi:ribulose-phosphate 3-epimerase [Pseudomonadota bacterium]
MKKIQIAPSILSADFGRLNEEIATIEPYCDLLHVDVMDGHFVPNITIGPPIVKCLKTKLPLDCHLMIENPDDYVEEFVKAGADSITIHQEVCPHLDRSIQKIKSLGVKAGASINPATPIEMIEEELDNLDMVLIMSVNPGFGGQSFIESVLGKIAAIRELAPDIDIQVDGGINAETSKLCIEAGANILVAGSYIFKSKDRKKAIESLRG